jgi:tetratricopeptide (TPR) repeat protein
MDVFGDMSAEAISRGAASLVMMCIVLAGIFKCAQIMRRPVAHRLCVSALLLVLIGILMSSMLVLLLPIAWMPFGARIALGSIALVCYIAGFVTATIGLLDLRKNGEAYRQGKTQARLALGLSTCLLLAFGTASYIKLKSLLTQNVATAQQPAAEKGKAHAATSEPAPKDKSVTSEAAAAPNDGTPTEAKLRRVLDKYNLVFDLPDAPWVKLDGREINPDIALMLRWDERDITFAMVPERAGVERAMTTDALVSGVQSRGRGGSDNTTIYAQREETFNELAGVHYEADSTSLGRAMHRAIWVAAKNGFTYQLHVYGPQAAAEQINEALHEMGQRLHQIDPNLVAHADGYEGAADFDSPQFGYRVELANTNWASWGDKSLEDVGMEYTARLGEQAMLAVMPVQLPDREIDLETLTVALLRRIKVSYPGPDIIRTGRLETQKHPGRSVEAWSSMTGTKRRTVARVIVGDRRALLVFGWVSNDDPDTRTALEDALDRVKETARANSAQPELTVTQRNVSALVNNDMGVDVQSRGDNVTATEFYKFAAELLPYDEQVFSNLINSLMLAKRTKDALAVVNERVANATPNSPLRALQARLLLDQGDEPQARKVLADLFRAGYFDENTLGTYIGLAFEAKVYDEAIGVVEHVVQSQPTLHVRRIQAVLYSRKGDYDKAFELLQKLHNEFPSEVEIALDLAEISEAKGDFVAALEVTQRLVDAGNKSEAVLIVLGRNQLNLHRSSQAKATFEQALALNPASSVVKDYLAHASSLAGEGDNTVLKTPLDAVEIPALVRSRIRDGKNAAPPAAEFDATELLNVTGIEYHRGKPLRTTRWREVKVHTTGGVSRYSLLSTRFDPLYERPYVNRLTVLNASGKQVGEGSVNEYYVVDDSGSGTANRKKVLNLPVPGLKPGYTLRAVMTTEELVPADSFRFQDFLLTSSMPTGVSAVFVHGDVASIAASSTPFAKIERTGDLIYCVQTNPKPYVSEPALPNPEHYLPVVWIGESGGKWEEIGQTYLKDINEKLAATTEIRQLAAELTKNCRTERDKLYALALHVQNDYTYQAIEFGRRARIPNPAAQTVRLKYGDCKDHAVLLYELLQSAGISSHLALVNTTGQLRPEMASLDQFNHMIVFVPKPPAEIGDEARNGLVLDCTEKDTDALLTPPVGLADKELLVLDPARPRIVRTANFPDDAARIISQRKITVTAGAGHGAVDTEVDEHISLNQFVAPPLRSYLRAYEPARRQQAVQEFLLNGSQLRLKDLTIQNLEDLDKPLKLDLKYSAPEAFRAVASSTPATALVGHLPSPWEKTYLGTWYVRERKSPFELEMPVRIESTVEVELPKGYELKDVDELAHSEQGRFVAWATRTQKNGDALKLEYRARRFTGRHGPEEYSAYYDAIKKALGVFENPLMIQSPAPKTAN